MTRRYVPWIGVLLLAVSGLLAASCGQGRREPQRVGHRTEGSEKQAPAGSVGTDTAGKTDAAGGLGDAAGPGVEEASGEPSGPDSFPVEQDPRDRFRIRVRNGRPYGFWGFIDRGGKVVIPPQWIHADDFFEGLALIRAQGGGPWTYVDLQGKDILADRPGARPAWIGWSCHDFSEGLAPVGQSQSGPWGYVDKKGNIAIEPRYEGAGRFSEGLAAVKHEGKWGYIDKKGQFVIEPQFDELPMPSLSTDRWGRPEADNVPRPFSEGLAAVPIGQRWGYVDKTGKLVIPARFHRASPFSCGLARVADAKGFGALDHEGRFFRPPHPLAGDFRDGLARIARPCDPKAPEVGGHTIIVPTGLPLAQFRYVNTKLKVVIDTWYDDARDFSEGLAAVRAGPRWGYIDRSGKMVIPPQFRIAGDFIGGLALVNALIPRAHGPWPDDAGYIDRQGRFVWTVSGKKPGENAVSDEEQQVLDRAAGATAPTGATFRANPQRTGAYEGGLAGPGKIKWKVERLGSIHASPVVYEDLVVVTGGRNVYALDAATGQKRWDFESRQDLPSSPVAAAGIVWVCHGPAAMPFVGRLEALDARTGKSFWFLQTSDAILGSPVVVDGVVYFSCGDGELPRGTSHVGLHAVEAATGKPLWHFGEARDVNSSPAVAGELVYVQACDCWVYAVDRKTGRQRWKQPAASPEVARYSTTVFPTPAVADGTVYVGSKDGRLLALDAATGEPRWTFKTGNGITCSPAVAHGRVYCASRDTHLYAIDAGSGREVWKVGFGSRFVKRLALASSPAVAEETVYFMLPNGTLHALAARDGAERWKLQLGGDQRAMYGLQSSPTIRDGVLYVGTEEGSLCAVEGQGDQP